MNNLFKAFKIEIPGQSLDDKLFFQYDDYDSNDAGVPDDAAVLAKAVAFTRMQQLKRKLSELTIPVYCTVEFATAGQAGVVPTGATITVGYISYEPFVSVVDPIPEDEADQITAAEATIKKIVEDCLGAALTGEMAYVQKTVERTQNPLVTTQVSLRDVFMDYIDVPAVAPATSTVTFVKL